jgi:NADH dehydrogenase [ubiquinone] 1 alpha subcomplex assembly factor 6
MDQPATQELSYCAEQVRASDPERYLCTLVAPPAAREPLFALFAFDAEIARVRHAVSQPMAGLIRLQWWRDALDGIAVGRPPAHPVAEALRDRAWTRLDPVRDRLEAAIDARERELEDETPIADEAALEQHLDATGATMTLAALHLLEAADVAAARGAGAHIGRAWALVHLMRSLPLDLPARRLLLPRSLLARHGLKPEELFERRGKEILASVVAELAGTVRRDLREGRRLRAGVPRAALATLLPAVFVDLHLKRLRRAGFDVFAPALARPMPAAPIRLLWRRLRGVY